MAVLWRLCSAAGHVNYHEHVVCAGSRAWHVCWCNLRYVVRVPCRSALPQMVMAGFLPFSAIYVELYYIFASVWGHKVYIIWSILFIVYIILIVVTAFITVALTYFQL